MTSSPHGLYVQGYTRATMAGTKRCKLARGSQSQKAGLSSDWSLQLDSMKLESLWVVLEVVKLTRKGGRHPRYDP